MASNPTHAGLEADLTQALDELHTALQNAADATAAIKQILPRISVIGSLFDEIDAVIRTGRQHIGTTDGIAAAVYSRPTLVVPGAEAGATSPSPFAAEAAAPSLYTPAENGTETTAQATMTIDSSREFTQGPSAPGLVCFRLEFESKPGPLDLRTVDDAVSEHSAVRDVALLDYDGRKATLKVWIDPKAATPDDVRNSLAERIPTLFDTANDVTIVALEDAA
jgi:hypothetical protein